MRERAELAVLSRRTPSLGGQALLSSVAHFPFPFPHFGMNSCNAFIHSSPSQASYTKRRTPELSKGDSHAEASSTSHSPLPVWPSASHSGNLSTHKGCSSEVLVPGWGRLRPLSILQVSLHLCHAGLQDAEVTVMTLVDSMPMSFSSPLWLWALSGPCSVDFSLLCCFPPWGCGDVLTSAHTSLASGGVPPRQALLAMDNGRQRCPVQAKLYGLLCTAYYSLT